MECFTNKESARIQSRERVMPATSCYFPGCRYNKPTKIENKFTLHAKSEIDFRMHGEHKGRRGKC